MKILVPVDGSSHSMEAVKTALDFVKMKGAEVAVISVVPFIGGMVDHEISPSRRERHMEGYTQVSEEAVRNACELLSKEGVTPMCSETVLASVSVPDAIIDFAEKEKVDLIIMGSLGLSKSTRFKLGSVASQVVKYCSCSVYLVKVTD